MSEMMSERIRRSKLRELMIFLMATFVSLILPAAFFCSESCPFSIIALNTIGRNIILLLLVFWFLKIRQESFLQIGLTLNQFKRHIFFGIIIFPGFYFSVFMILDFLTYLGLSHLEDIPPSLAPQGIWQIILGVVLVLVVAICEEVIFRGYLLTRIEEVTGNTCLAVFLSTLLFTLGHGYEGIAGMLAVAYIGLVFSLLYLWRKSLTMVIVLHFFTIFIPIVIIPLMQYF